MAQPDERTAWIGTTEVVPWMQRLSRMGQQIRPEEIAVTPEPTEPPTGSLDTVHIFVDNSGQYRFHRKAANGKIIGDGAESFPRLFNARRAALRNWPDRQYRIVRDDTGEVLFDPQSEASE